MTMMKVTIYTDGACSGNPGKGGWGAYLKFGEHTKEISGSKAETTNNQMELQACIEALKALTKPCEVTLYTDSTYVKDGITKWVFGWQKNGWKTSTKKPVKNVEFWQELLEQTKRHKVDWNWVKGHAGVEGNEIADRLATSAIN